MVQSKFGFGFACCCVSTCFCDVISVVSIQFGKQTIETKTAYSVDCKVTDLAHKVFFQEIIINKANVLTD